MKNQIKLKDTLSVTKKEINKPHSETVNVYCCGVTPYDHTHIGHTRTFFSFDLLCRTLRDNGYQVNSARNITDVDDKIINRASQECVSCEEITTRYINEQKETLKDFGMEPPVHEPKVTEHIPQIVSFIDALVKKSLAYVTTSGVYYRVRHFADYGKLSKNKIDDLKQGARIDVDETKEDALDFALWKFTKKSDEPGWDSPWGRGRPGWHVECSTMIHSLFGETIDIHMGGRDLIFPHHEAEIAQSEGVTGKPLAGIWMHTGMVTLYGEKMSKSSNHYVAIKDFLTKYPPEALRLFFLSVSYSQPLDFTFEVVVENVKKLAKMYRFLDLVDSYALSSEVKTTPTPSLNLQPGKEEIFSELPTLINAMRMSLADDLNSPAALATLFDFIRNINVSINHLEKQGLTLTSKDQEILQTAWPAFKSWIKNALGILTQEPHLFFEDLRKLNVSDEISTTEIENRIQEREKARAEKNWTISDSIRQELLSHGVMIQDTPRGTKWSVLL